MRKVVITTDSTSDLSNELLKKYEIYTIPLYVRFGEEIYKDGVDLNTLELYKKVKEKNELPKTMAVSPGDFEEFFKSFLIKDCDIVHISIGSKISGSYQSAVLASQLLDENRVFVVDSQNLSSGIALLAFKGKDFRDQGLDAKTIKKELDKLVLNVRSQFVIKTMDYLYKGGRASGLQALFGTMLKIRPIIQVRDGILNVYKKPLGRLKKGYDIMLEDFFNEGNNLDLDYVMITHSLNDEGAKYMMEKVKEKVKVKNLIESHAGCVISSHCGEGTIGILYIVKN